MDVGALCMEGTGLDAAGGPLKQFISSSLSPLDPPPTFFTCMMTWLSFSPTSQLEGHLYLLPQAPPMDSIEAYKQLALINAWERL